MFNAHRQQFEMQRAFIVCLIHPRPKLSMHRDGGSDDAFRQFRSQVFVAGFHTGKITPQEIGYWNNS
jgi:hypothetical protein